MVSKAKASDFKSLYSYAKHLANVIFSEQKDFDDIAYLYSESVYQELRKENAEGICLLYGYDTASKRWVEKWNANGRYSKSELKEWLPIWVLIDETQIHFDKLAKAKYPDLTR